MLQNAVIGLGIGFVSTIIMTIVMVALGGGPNNLPSTKFWEKFVGSNKKNPMGMVIHLLYGSFAGLGYAVFVGVLNFETLLIIIGAGVGIGVILTMIGMLVWVKTILGLDPNTEEKKRFILAHLTYTVFLTGLYSFAFTYLM